MLDIAQHPADMGKLGVDNMLVYFDGSEPEKTIDTGTGVIDKENVQEYMDDYMQYVAN